MRKTDWTPLAGRQVLIWPDNDEPGARYRQDVAKELTELGCDVAIVNVAALAEIDGGARRSDFDPVGWDAADAINKWQDLNALREAIVGLSKTVDPGPAYVSVGPYTMDLAASWLSVGMARRSEWKRFGSLHRSRCSVNAAIHAGKVGGRCCVGAMRIGSNTFAMSPT